MLLILWNNVRMYVMKLQNERIYEGPNDYSDWFHSGDESHLSLSLSVTPLMKFDILMFMRTYSKNV